MNNQKSRFMYKTIATILVFVMVFYFAPVPIFAKEILRQVRSNIEIISNESEMQMIEEPKSTIEEVEQPKIIGEDVQKRTPNEKHLVLEDGSSIALVYPRNIHYQENGEYVDINNTLEQKTEDEQLKLSTEEILKEQIEMQNKENLIQKDMQENNLEKIDTVLEASNQLDNLNEKEELTSFDSDNNLTTFEKGLEVLEKRRESKIYENKSNSFKVGFTNKTKEYNLGTMTSMGHTIKWRMKYAKSTSINVDNPEENEEFKGKTSQDEIKMNQISSSIKYQNILSYTDIKYAVQSEQVKESIILRTKQAMNNKLVFEYDLDGLKMKITNTNEVIIYDTAETNTIFTIEAPFMYDSNLEFSDDINMNLIEEDGKYILTIIPNKEWLESEERVYPVTIDPTINTSTYREDLKDTYIFQGDTNYPNRYNAHILRVGSNNRVNYPTRTLIKFTLPKLNAADQVIAAKLSLCSYPNTNEWTPPTNEFTIDIHQMTADWTSETANWNNTNANYDSKIADYIKYLFDSNQEIKRYYFDITSVVKDWYVTGNNYGVMIKDHVETYGYNTSDVYFFSSDINSEYNVARPIVQIAYRSQSGLEDYLSYHAQEIGRAGTVYTNNYNGNLTLLHQDAQTPGNRLPVTMNHVYNTNSKDTNIAYGNGFRLNLSQKVMPVILGDTYYAKYTDEDGTAHYFLRQGTSNTYVDEDNSNISLVIENHTCTMTDKAQNKLVFEERYIGGGAQYHLKEITNTDGNKITLTLGTATSNGNHFTITKVTDGAGSEINLSYTNDLLTKIVDSAGRETTYTYVNNNLTQITYPDGKKSIYTYENNKLISVKNIDQSHVDYEYYSDKANRVKSIKEYSTSNEIGNSLEISYGTNTTTFQNHQGYRNTYSFNSLGQTISIADYGTNSSIDNAYGKMYEYGEGKNDSNRNDKNKLTLESKLISIKDMSNNLLQNPCFEEGLTSWRKNSGCYDYDTVVEQGNNHIAYMAGSAYKEKFFVQSVNTTGTGGDIFTLAGWVKANGVKNDTTTNKSTRFTVAITKNDNTTQWVDIPINTDSNAWQYVSKEIIAEADYKRVDVYLIVYNNANATCFDNIGLFKEEFGQSYRYDESGNIVNSKDSANQNSTFAYNSNSDVISAVNPKGAKYTYEYDYTNKNRLVKATNNTGQNYTFSYDYHGNITESKLQETQESETLENGKSYYMRFASGYKYVEIGGGEAATSNGAELNQWVPHTNKNMQFKIQEVDGDGYVKISPNQATSKYLTLNTETNFIKQWDWGFGEDTKKWKFISNEDGTYRIACKEKGDDYVLTLENDSDANGAKVKLEKWEGKTSQKLYLYDVNGYYNLTNDGDIESNDLYYIRVKSSNLYLEQESDSETALLIQNTYKAKNKNQLWRIVRINGNGLYKLVNVQSKNGYVMDVKNGTNAADNPVQMYTASSPNISQEWYIRKNTDGTYGIISSLSGTSRRLSVYGNSLEAGTRVGINDDANGDHQKFYLEKADLCDIESGATYKIKAKVSNLYMTVNSNYNIEQSVDTNTDNQKWIVKDLKNGYYAFIPKSDQGKMMDLDSYNTSNGTNIHAYYGTANEAQQFEIVSCTDGSFTIKPKSAQGKTCLDVSGGATASGANIQNWESNETISQHFYFEKVESSSEGQYIQGKAEYSQDGKYLTKSIDQTENSTSYEYNDLTGTTSKVIDAKQNATSYTYDILNNVTQIQRQVGANTSQIQYSYDNDRISRITHNGFNYSFIYDTFGNKKQVKVGEEVLVTNNYEQRNGNLSSIVYGNGQTINYEYDRFQRISKKTGINGNYTYSYDAKGNIKTIQDTVNNSTQTYTYDLGERIVKKENTNGSSIEYEYDANSNVNSVKDKLTTGDTTTENITKYNYDRDNRINNIKLDDNNLIITNYDRLSRMESKQIKSGDHTYQINYTYRETETPNRTTTMIQSLKNGNNPELVYSYDSLGNIEKISKGEEEVQKYYYDELNQLVRENNKELGKTITYTYDLGGNLLQKKEYEYLEGTISIEPKKVVTYGYENTNWKDQLTNYNGNVITYDGIGNPISYAGNIYTWSNGRQLEAITNQEKNLSIQYKYNEAGIRTKKIVNGQETNYYLDGDKVIYEQTGDNILYYTYDEQGEVIGVKYNNNQYYFVKNTQNDVLLLLDENLNQVVEYKYDSWGNIEHILDANGQEITDKNHIGNINPYRYRGYRYDNETQMYYLQSRYYNPEWGRFINADAMISTGQGLLSHNMYAYCENNPINRMDPSGNSWFSAIVNTVKNIVQQVAKAVNTVGNAVKSVVNTVSPKNNVVLSSSNNGHGNVPITGKPNSTVTKPNGDIRVYGPDGKALKDIDYSHPQKHPELENPHEHDWDWSNTKKPRGDAHNFGNIGVGIGVGVGVGIGGYAIYRGIRMLPSLLPPLWWTIPANVTIP